MDSMIELLKNKYNHYGQLKENMVNFKQALECGERTRIDQLSREREEILKNINVLDELLFQAGILSEGARKSKRPGSRFISSWLGILREVWGDIFHINLECLRYAEIQCRDLKSEMVSMGREVLTVKNHLAPLPYTTQCIEKVKGN